MLTRVEIDGFKSFRAFSADLLPFQVILGPNAAGKSNLFDALHLLSRLAEVDLQTAFQDLRGEPLEMFSFVGPSKAVHEMTFAVEVLLDSVVRDPWSVEVEVKHSRVRYELKLARRKAPNGIERLYVTKEEMRPILDKDDTWPGLKLASKEFKGRYVVRGRRAPWLVTREEAQESGQPPILTFEISQDGRAGRKRPADAAESTNLSGITSAEFPHLFALREELRSWRFLQLNPEGLRRPSSALAVDHLKPDGSNLAAVLARIKNETRTEQRPDGVIADISTTLTHLVPGVQALSIIEDKAKKEYRIDVQMQDGFHFASRVLSDGTLRILALITLMHDPQERGLVCFEEPENGVHPFRLRQVIDMLRALATNLTEREVPPREPLKQLLLNSHSPVVLKYLEASQMLFADVVSRAADRDSGNGPVRCTRLRPVLDEFMFNDRDATVTRDYVDKYLSSTKGEGLV